MLTAVFLVSCASAVPPARIGEYVSSWPLVGGEAFTRIDQRPVHAGLVMVSDMAEPGAAPNLPEGAIQSTKGYLTNLIWSGLIIALLTASDAFN